MNNMNSYLKSSRKLGINGVGRIGKLTLWNHLIIGHFDGFIINTGRIVGQSLEDFIDYLTTDSTYGTIHTFFYGYSGKKCEITITDKDENIFTINNVPIKIISRSRNPREINWAREDVRLVVECTGVFVDPSAPAENSKGSVRGHLEAGAEKVMVSAPFKIKDNALKIPADSSTFVYGINHTNYDPDTHHIVSAASCTTTGLAHMVKPLMDTRETSEIITASMTTVHAATNNQNILDGVPASGSSDLRKSRSVFNNIILTTTGAAFALEDIIPEIKMIGLMADSVRVPVNTASLIVLNVTFNAGMSETGVPLLNRSIINNIYKNSSRGPQKDMLIYTDRQNVSSDMIGYRAAIVIEGSENHTRTGFIPVTAKCLRDQGVDAPGDVNIPVTHAKIFGWYDNELGSYVNFLGKLTVYVDKNMH